MPTKSEAIKRFLEAKTHPDLAALYSLDMECQVNVGQDGGDRVDGEFKGRKWHGWTDGHTMWKSFRIPIGANKDPHYEDTEIKFDLAEHAEGIGMTGWNWKLRASIFVAYDYDAIVGHSEKHQKKLTNAELDEVLERSLQIPWITARKSTSGKGLHTYVFFDTPVPTKNHNEHAALARAVLGKMSALTGYSFQSKLDVCGGNMWVWHRKMVGTDGLTIIKEGRPMQEDEVPVNWQDHITVVSRKSRKARNKNLDSTAEELSTHQPKVPLDEEHRKLTNFLEESKAYWWWQEDMHMLVTHTYHLKEAHSALNLRGVFDTISEGKERGNDHNCFLFPLRRGIWAVRRYSKGVAEHPSWDQDGAGWTRCYLNRPPDLATASRAHGGLEKEDGSFTFRTAEEAQEAAKHLGMDLAVPPALNSRKTILKPHKDGNRIVVKIDHDEHDDGGKMSGYTHDKKLWVKIFNANLAAPMEPETGNYDDTVRHLVTETDEDFGWLIKSDGVWRSEPLGHVKVALSSLGLSNKEVTSILGTSIFRCWKLVNKPFQPEYPGDREWNRNAAQLKFSPTRDKEDLKYPTWTKILNHVGSGLDEEIKNNSWAKANGILNGGDYYKCWIASLFQYPLEHLPYLFFYGPQNSGKSIFHEALSLLLTKGYQRADAALISQAGFNAELEGAILCIVEETNLHKNKQAYNRIKDWVTSLQLPIHRKGKTPYHTPNSTHWIQCSNEHQACPIFTGDTRITMCYVKSLDPFDQIPKKRLLQMLVKEAPDFIAEILNLEIPPSPDRLNVPVIGTQDKTLAQALTETPLETFIKESCIDAPGRVIKFSEFYLKYNQWCETNGEAVWSKIKVGRELPPQYPKGRLRQNNQIHIGNIFWRNVDPKEPAGRVYIVKGDYLEQTTSNDS